MARKLHTYCSLNDLVHTYYGRNWRNWIFFLAVQYCFRFLLVQWEKIHNARRKYSLRNYHTYHPKISPDRQGEELVTVQRKLVSQLVFWTQLTTKDYIRAKTNFNPSSIYSSHRSSDQKFPQSLKISPNTNLHITKHTQTSNTKFSKN